MAAVNISLNGTDRTVGAATLRQLLDELQTPATGIAVAQNDEVVRREELDGARINDGDRIEIIRAVAGG